MPENGLWFLLLLPVIIAICGSAAGIFFFLGQLCFSADGPIGAYRLKYRACARGDIGRAEAVVVER
eukprot:288742-Prymnesium_polylepis.1